MWCREKVKCGAHTSQFTWSFVIVEMLVRVVFAMGIVVCYQLSPFERHMSQEEWKDHMYPHLSEVSFPGDPTTIANAMCQIAVMFIWLLIFKFFRKWSNQKVFTELFMAFLSASLVFFTSFVLTGIIKNAYGRPRPDFLGRCYGNNAWPTIIPPIPKCEGASKGVIAVGRMSFPSGHSSGCFASFLWIALYSYNGLSHFEDTGGLRLGIPLCILVYPLVVAISRTRDYRHFHTDIIGGSIIGILTNVLIFPFYHPIAPCRHDRRWAYNYKPFVELRTTDETLKGQTTEVVVDPPQVTSEANQPKLVEHSVRSSSSSSSSTSRS